MTPSHLALVFLIVMTCALPTSAQEADDLAAYLRQLPVAGKNQPSFQTPTPEEMAAWGQLLSQVLASDPTGPLRKRAAGLGYRIDEVRDAASGARFVALREAASPTEPGYLGRGSVVLRLEEASPIIIEVPHPRFDLDTDELGFELLQDLNARALILAGAHRHSLPDPSPCQPAYQAADVAHRHATFFQQAHQVLWDADPNALVLQVHGFGGREGVDAIASEGVRHSPAPRAPVRRVVSELGQAGYNARLYPDDIGELGGTLNVQGRYSNGSRGHLCTEPALGASGRFIHLELARPLRQDRGRVRAALSRALTGP